MKPHRFQLVPALLAAGLALDAAGAAVLTRAEVSHIQNDVQIVTPDAAPRPAKVRDAIQGRTGVRTGAESRAELTFEDSTLARLGANTLFRFEQGTRDLELDRGTLLLQVPKGAGGAKIKTAAVTAAITGTTVMIEYTPSSGGKPGYIKLIVLEGTLRAALNKRAGESILLKPGQMLILSPDANRLPEPVTIDLERLVATSPLIRDRFAQLAGDDLIRKEIGRQEGDLIVGELLETNLSLFGEGNVVWLTDDAVRSVTDSFPPIPVPPGGSGGSPNVPGVGGPGSPGSNPGSGGGGGGGEEPPPPPPPPAKYGPVPLIPGAYSVGGNTLIVTDPTITTANVTHEGRIYRSTAEDGVFSQYLFGSTSAFDTELGVDGPLQPAHPVTIYKFETLELAGTPTFNTTNGPTRVGLIARDGITTAPSVGPIGMLLFSIDGLSLATVDGPISIGPLFGFDSAGAPLVVYARGATSDLSFLGDLVFGNGELQERLADAHLAAERDLLYDGDFYGRDLNLEAGRDLLLASLNGSINGDQVMMTAGGNISINSYVEAQFLYVDAAGELTVDGDSYLSTQQADLVAERITTGNTDIFAYNTPSSSSIPSIGLRSRATSGTGIQIQDSTQLLALAEAAGTKAHILIQTQGGGIVVAGGASISASANTTNGAEPARLEILSNGGQIDIGTPGGTAPPALLSAIGGILEVDTRNAAVDGIVNLHNSSLAADTLRIRAYGPNGQLNIHGGTLSAASQLKLYAGGSNGIVRFHADTTLNTGTGLSAIAAKTVRIDDGVDVAVNGSILKIFADVRQFNEVNGGDDSTSGKFIGSGAPGVEDVEPFNSANKPPFP